MLDLARARVGVLASRVQVVAGAALLIEAENDLLARLVLGRDVVGGEGLDAVLAAPGQGLEETLLGVLEGPFGGAEVAEETLAREPLALRVG